MNRRLFLALVVKMAVFLMVWPLYAIKLAFRTFSADTVVFVLFGLVGYTLAGSWSPVIVQASYLFVYLAGSIPALNVYKRITKPHAEDVFAVVCFGAVVLGILAHVLVGLFT